MADKTGLRLQRSWVLQIKNLSTAGNFEREIIMTSVINRRRGEILWRCEEKPSFFEWRAFAIAADAARRKRHEEKSCDFVPPKIKAALSAASDFWWRWRESNPRVDWVWSWYLHTYSIWKGFSSPSSPMDRLWGRLFTLESQQNPDNMILSRALSGAACTLAPGRAQRRGRLKQPMRTLRSQLLVWPMIYEANDHPRYAINPWPEPVESGTPPSHYLCII